jgi:predicted acylesterase/phospholipase RssA
LEKISEVVYQSCSYPWVFEAENGICDGGLSDNFPIAQLQCKNPLGFVFEKIVSKEKIIPKTLVQYSLGIAAGIKSRLEKEYTGSNIIQLKTFDIHSLNFDIIEDEKKQLFDEGVNQVKQYYS